MTIRRRDFLRETAFGAALLTVLGERAASFAAAPGGKPAIRVGGPDWSLGKEGDPASFTLAKERELDGVEVSCGKGKEHLPLTDAAHREKFAAAARKEGLAIPSTCLEILHRDGLKDHPDAPKWVEEAIAITHALGAKTILLPFFGPKAIEKRAEQEAVADRLKPLAPLAEKAGVVLGLENTITAEDNARILDRVGSPAVKVYYDVGNSFPRGYDVYKEVAWLGKARLAQIHLKDGSTQVGKGKIDFPRFIEALVKSGFEGWTLLETSPKPMKEEAAYVRGLLAKA